MSTKRGNPRRGPLPILDAVRERVANRSAAIRDEHPYWPCAAGCDECCRTLPSLPIVTLAEWQSLRAALYALPDHERDGIEERIRGARSQGPLVCPMLDETRGACRVYEARPVACRTYGFYTERDAGLHCRKVSAAVREHDAEQRVVWGNGEAIAYDLRDLGKPRPVDAWLRDDC